LHLEEAIYLAELGAAAILTNENACECLSLSQLYGLLPSFGLSLFHYAAFRTLIKATYLVRKPEWVLRVLTFN
jgi:hypothetical protein